jgi:hypothetical protein
MPPRSSSQAHTREGYLAKLIYLLTSRPLFNKGESLPSLWLASINITNPHVSVNLAVSQVLAHLHEENLIVILAPLQDIVPQEKRVT